MSKKSFVPKAEGPLRLWLNNFNAKLPGAAAKYNISQDELNLVQQASVMYDFWVDAHNQTEQLARKITAYKNELRNGLDLNLTATQLPAIPAIYSRLQTIRPGVVQMAIDIAVSIKKKPQYTEADGLDLGLEGATHDDAIARMQEEPVISVRLSAANHPEIVWTKGNMDSVEIHKDNGNGEWAFLAIDAYPNYIDNAPLPSKGQSAIWKYKAIYRKRDEQAGAWSAVSSITVSE